MFKQWDSIEQLISEVPEGDCQAGWTGDITDNNVAKSLSIRGDDKLVEQAQKYIYKLTDLRPEIKAHQWIAAPSGSFPAIPDYISGSPTSMRLRRKMVSDISPVRIFVSTTCSGGNSSADMLNRGLAITALLMRLQMLRPVELFILIELGRAGDDGNIIATVSVPSKPLNLGQTAFLLSHTAFSRGLTYPACKQFSFNGSWPKQYKALGGTNFEPSYQAWLREYAGINPQDIIVPAAHVRNITSDPIKWINKMLFETLGDMEQD